MSTRRFATICADPPWSFSDRLPGPSRGAERNYRVMSIDDLCGLELPQLADDCRLFMWRVASQVEEAYRVVRSWGFTPKTEVVWRKLTGTGKEHFGMGRTVRGSHEACIVAVRGKPAVLNRGVRSVFSAAVGRHSEKPEAFYRDIVERLSPGPYLELFGRRSRTGWTVVGDQAPEPKRLEARK